MFQYHRYHKIQEKSLFLVNYLFSVFALFPACFSYDSDFNKNILHRGVRKINMYLFLYGK